MKLNALSPRNILFVFEKLYWLVLTIMPMTIDYAITDFMIKGCMPGSKCLPQTMPLIVDMGIIGWVFRFLVWPLCAWHLGGRWIYAQYKGHILNSNKCGKPGTYHD